MISTDEIIVILSVFVRYDVEQPSKLDRVRADYNVHYWSQGFFGIDDQAKCMCRREKTKLIKRN